MSALLQSFSDIEAAVAQCPPQDREAVATAGARDAILTKPPGALGRLEALVRWLAAWQGRAIPSVDTPQVIVFAGNHGVTAQGVSAFPAEVTAQMVANFQADGAAINQLAKLAGARVEVVPLDLDRPTQDFTVAPAMTEAETCAAFSAGWDAVDPEADILILGEMGIGNTTSAAAIAAALLGGTGADWAGRGTGVSDEGVALKARVIDAGLERHADRAPLSVLAALGGREIAAMAGAMARARVESVPVLLDGFIASAAALVIQTLSFDLLMHVQAGHVSEEGAHAKLLSCLGLTPILDLQMRLGEGSGAAVALQVVRAAVACHAGMATFAEAGVSEG